MDCEEIPVSATDLFTIGEEAERPDSGLFSPLDE